MNDIYPSHHRTWDLPLLLSNNHALSQPSAFYLFFVFLNIYLFIWLHRVLVAACRIFHCGTQASLVVAHGLHSCNVQTLECAGSVVAACRLSCPTARGILVPQPGIEPASPALEGGFLTTGPPGKSLCWSGVSWVVSETESLASGDFYHLLLPHQNPCLPCVCIWLIRFVVQQKLTWYCEAIILQ